jgi:cytochrome c
MSTAHSYKKPHHKSMRIDQTSSLSSTQSAPSSSAPSAPSAPPTPLRAGTALEAIRLVKQAITYLNTHGKEQVLQAINTPGGPFRLHDLYVTVLDIHGKGLAHGADPEMAGRNALEQCDVEGKTFIRERIAIAKSQGFGWQQYKYSNPAKGGAIESKAMYLERVGDWIFACGIYTE